MTEPPSIESMRVICNINMASHQYVIANTNTRHYRYMHIIIYLYIIPENSFFFVENTSNRHPLPVVSLEPKSINLFPLISIGKRIIRALLEINLVRITNIANRKYPQKE